MEYKILGEENDLRHRNSIEINGKIRFAGEILDEKEFKPASGVIVHTVFPDGSFTDEPELSELESLIKSKHIEEVK